MHIAIWVATQQKASLVRIYAQVKMIVATFCAIVGLLFPLIVDGRLWSLIVAFPGHLHHCILLLKQAKGCMIWLNSDL